MKRTLITIDVEPELKQHLIFQAYKKKTTLSKYVRAGLKKVSHFKDQKLV